MFLNKRFLTLMLVVACLPELMFAANAQPQLSSLTANSSPIVNQPQNRKSPSVAYIIGRVIGYAIVATSVYGIYKSGKYIAHKANGLSKYNNAR